MLVMNGDIMKDALSDSQSLKHSSPQGKAYQLLAKGKDRQSSVWPYKHFS